MSTPGTGAGAFHTETPVMQTSAAHVREVNAQVTSELGRLRETVAATQGRWKGSGQVTFQQIMLKWDEDAKKLTQALEAIAELIETGGRSYDVADADATSTLKSAAGSGLQMS